MCLCVGMWEKGKSHKKIWTARIICRLRAGVKKTSHKKKEQVTLNFTFLLLLERYDSNKKKLFEWFWKKLSYIWLDGVGACASLFLQSGNLHQLFTEFYVLFFCTLLSFCWRIRDRELNDIWGSLPIVPQFSVSVTNFCLPYTDTLVNQSRFGSTWRKITDKDFQSPRKRFKQNFRTLKIHNFPALLTFISWTNEFLD